MDYTIVNISQKSPTLVCPGMTIGDDKLSIYGGKWQVSYGFNSDARGGWMRGVRLNNIKTMSTVSRPSDKVYAMDWGMVHLRTDKFNSLTSASYSGAYVPGAGSYGVLGTNAIFTEDLVNGRHDQRVTVLYIDGHAAIRTSEEMTNLWHRAGFSLSFLYERDNHPFSIGGR